MRGKDAGRKPKQLPFLVYGVTDGRSGRLWFQSSEVEKAKDRSFRKLLFCLLLVFFLVCAKGRFEA